MGSNSNRDHRSLGPEDAVSNRHRVLAGRPRIGSTRDRGGRAGSDANGRCRMPSGRAGTPCTIASYRFRTNRFSNARPSAARAGAERANTSSPDVSRSSRCTASRGPKAARTCDATHGGSSDVRAGTLGMPAGLSTTIRCSSANTTQMPASLHGSAEADGSVGGGRLTAIPATRPMRQALPQAHALPAPSAVCP